jgi:hypothetical protein
MEKAQQTTMTKFPATSATDYFLEVAIGNARDRLLPIACY